MIQEDEQKIVVGKEGNKSEKGEGYACIEGKGKRADGNYRNEK